MHMKYFQGIADVQRHYAEILSKFRDIDAPEGEREIMRLGALAFLESWNISLDEREEIEEEHEVLRYLLGCQTRLVRGQNAKKPTLEAVERCFNRHILFLNVIFRVDDYNVNKYPNPLIRKQFKTCRHYLFKFSLPAWYEKLPAEILTFENKYPNYHRNI